MARKIPILPINMDNLLHCRGVESERVEFKASWEPATTGPQVLRGSSVFPAPARETLDAQNYQDACHISKRAIGKKISKQTFAILPKVCEVDQLLQGDEKARVIVREVHPELCFWGLNHRRPMQNNKKKLAGRNERLELIEKLWPQAKAALSKIYGLDRRKQVAHDDIADAMAAALTARAKPSKLNSLPEPPPEDSEGLPMQMIWAAREAVQIKRS